MTSATMQRQRWWQQCCPVGDIATGGVRWHLGLMWLLVLMGGCSSTVTVHRIAVGSDDTEVQGEVRSTNEGLRCPSRCTLAVRDDEELTLEAQASPGWVFLGWEGGCEGRGHCVLRPREDTAVTARFAPLRQLRVERAGRGRGTLDVLGPCPEECDRSFPRGTQVTLRATPNQDSHFVGWEGACSGDAACVLTLDEHRTVTARFEPLPGSLLDSRTLRRPPEQLGPVALSPRGQSVTVHHEGRRVLVEEQGDEVDGTTLSASLPTEDFSRVHAFVGRRGGGYFLSGSAAPDDCVFARADERLALKWRRVVPNCGSASFAASIAAKGAAAVVFAGTFGSLGSTLDFEGTPLRTRGTRDIFLARYDDRGTLLAVHTVGTPKDDELRDLATGPDGEVVLSWCGGGTCYLTSLDATGQVRWEHRHAKTTMTVTGVDILGSGVIAAAGEAQLRRGEALVLGASLAPAQASALCGASTGFVALLDGARGHARALVPVGTRVADLVARRDRLVAAVIEVAPGSNSQGLPASARRRHSPTGGCGPSTLRLQELTKALDLGWQLGLPTDETAPLPTLVSAEDAPLLVLQLDPRGASSEGEPAVPALRLTRVH